MVNFVIIAIVAVICLAVGWYFGYNSGFADGFKKCEYYDYEDDYYDGF